MQPPAPQSLDDLLAEVQQQTERIAEARARLDRQELTGVTGGGEVTVRLLGSGQFIEIQIDPDTLRRYPPDVVGSFVLDAVNDGLRRMKEAGDAAFGPLMDQPAEPSEYTEPTEYTDHVEPVGSVDPDRWARWDRWER